MAYTVSRIISDDTLSRVIHVESAGDPKAKAKTSSASGLGQFIDGTWLAMITKHRPDLARGRSKAQILALRFNPTLAVEILARFTEDNARFLGAGWTDGDLYLAHFAGAGTARAILRAPADSPVSKYVSSAAIGANRSILAGKTAGDVRAWANRKMVQAGGKGWVDKWYRPNEVAVALDTPDQAPTAAASEMSGREKRLIGDPDILDIQTKLKEMHYNPGEVDGEWGGNTAGAISGFLNDMPGSVDIDAPTSAAMFRHVFPELKRLVDQQYAAGFRRPVSEKRKEADLPKVAEKAPEVVPVRQGFFAGVWAFFVSAFTAVGGAAKSAWDWFTGARDNVDPTIWDVGMGYVSAVPVWVWAIFVCGVLAFIVVKQRQGVQGIVDAVQSGDRL